MYYLTDYIVILEENLLLYLHCTTVNPAFGYHTTINPNFTWLVTSRLDTTRHARRVEPMHFGCIELVVQHGSTHSSRRARHVEHVVSCRVEK